jgi:hypothetical protein
MSEQEEFAPVLSAIEAETNEVTATPEATSEVRESAGHAAAIIALNESAARSDWPTDRVDAARAQLDAKFAPAAQTDILGNIESAQDQSQTEERSHAAALAALDYEKQRADLLNLEEVATHGDWPQDRVDAAKAQIEANYAK